VKARALHTRRLTLGVGLAVTLPTATDSEFAGSDKASLRSLALITIAASPNLTLHINAGAVFRTKAAFANIEQRSGAAGGVGASLRIAAPLSVSLEAFGESIPSGYHAEPAPGETMGVTSNLTTIEALGAARYEIARTFAISIGVGRGVTSGIGAPDLRGVVMLAYVPTAHGPATHPVVTAERPIDPNVSDRDHDRIPDAVDKCPDDPEDKDGFEDADGCPDPDNDKDGVADEADKCPEQPEDRDGFEDSDGCPELDNDKDGIPDATDKCPLEPEKINGFEDNDGCPDPGEPLVMSTPERIELVQSVVFTGSTISNSSANVLGQLAATLRARTDIVRLRITAHVQPSKSRDNDQALSEQRAAAVRDWLLNWGIANSRLEIRGLGGTKPLVRPTNKGAALVNDRIELIIIERN
jgi:outer membrane protein OmpA-like peptidoglycan-associated protein